MSKVKDLIDDISQVDPLAICKDIRSCAEKIRLEHQEVGNDLDDIIYCSMVLMEYFTKSQV